MTTTLITGASSGIGAEFAARLAARKHDLVLVARSRDKLAALAARLRQSHGVVVEVIALDLASPTAAAELHAETDRRGLQIDWLINNAGFGIHGVFGETDLARLASQVQLNCGTLVDLTGAYLPAMRRRGSGAVINVASTASFQPIPRMAVYGATKAFVLSFTEALWGENRTTGVRVLAVCPGATETGFFEVAGEAAAAGAKRSPAQVVTTALTALDRNRPSVVDGFGNAFVSRLLTRLVPKRALIGIAGRAVAA
ncbi:SDR family NAD(P)-dependent oxidoreductase [Frondihabitans cladoniiphilus]|uniref:SDR family oxidoreductase n=1 Tax=Frondihabitans cladoniiphilus TaxID=715785 RepID=A0ABP8W0L4_9MICO